MTTETTKKRTITLTGRRPVTIVDDNWPTIAKADWHNGGEFSCNSNRSYSIRVRQHEDGRVIVYATFTSSWAGECNRREGRLLDSEDQTTDIVSVIKDVCEDIGAPDQLVSDCIANLPSEELT
jgi:hypothetical protein